MVGYYFNSRMSLESNQFNLIVFGILHSFSDVKIKIIQVVLVWMWLLIGVYLDLNWN